MMMKALNCCGAAELVGINDSNWNPTNWLLFYVDEYNVNLGCSGKGWVPFCYAYDVNRRIGVRSKSLGMRRLKAWKKFIEDNGLGSVHLIEEHAYNPNYGKTIKLASGIFLPDNLAIKKYVTGGVKGKKKLRETKAEMEAKWQRTRTPTFVRFK